MHCNKSLLSKRETVCLFNQLFVQVMENMEKLHIDNKQAAKLNKERFMVAIFFFKNAYLSNVTNNKKRIYQVWRNYLTH